MRSSCDQGASRLFGAAAIFTSATGFGFAGFLGFIGSLAAFLTLAGFLGFAGFLGAAFLLGISFAALLAFAGVFPLATSFRFTGFLGLGSGLIGSGTGILSVSGRAEGTGIKSCNGRSRDDQTCLFSHNLNILWVNGSLEDDIGHHPGPLIRSNFRPTYSADHKKVQSAFMKAPHATQVRSKSSLSNHPIGEVKITPLIFLQICQKMPHRLDILIRITTC